LTKSINVRAHGALTVARWQGLKGDIKEYANDNLLLSLNRIQRPQVMMHSVADSILDLGSLVRPLGPWFRGDHDLAKGDVVAGGVVGSAEGYAAVKAEKA
jgi:hypothetical protein